MKMSDVFKDSKQIGSFDRFVCQTGYDDLATFNTEQQAQAAAHAIRQHDELVAMNAELVEALEELSGIVQGVIDESEPLNIKDHVDSFTLQPSINALLKAKELAQ